MEQILLAYGLHRKTITTIIMLYKVTKAMVRSPVGETDFLLLLLSLESCKEIDSYSLK